MNVIFLLKNVQKGFTKSKIYDKIVYVLREGYTFKEGSVSTHSRHQIDM